MFFTRSKHSKQSAELHRMASGGIANQMRSGMAEGNDTVLNLGFRRFAPTREDYALGNCVMAIVDGHTSGMIPASTLRERRKIDPGFDPVTWLYAELEQELSLYFFEILCYPNQRGPNIGEAFMIGFAERRADSGLNRNLLLQYVSDALLMVRTSSNLLGREPCLPTPTTLQ